MKRYYRLSPAAFCFPYRSSSVAFQRERLAKDRTDNLFIGHDCARLGNEPKEKRKTRYTNKKKRGEGGILFFLFLMLFPLFSPS